MEGSRLFAIIGLALFVATWWWSWRCCARVENALRALIEFKHWQEGKNRDCGCPDDITKPPPKDPDWP